MYWLMRLRGVQRERFQFVLRYGAEWTCRLWMWQERYLQMRSGECICFSTHTHIYILAAAHVIAVAQTLN